MNLRILGPTPLPPQVEAALRRPMINHRGAVFADMHRRIVARLQAVFQTANDILIVPASGTGVLVQAGALSGCFNRTPKVIVRNLVKQL